MSASNIILAPIAIMALGNHLETIISGIKERNSGKIKVGLLFLGISMAICFGLVSLNAHMK